MRLLRLGHACNGHGGQEQEQGQDSAGRGPGYSKMGHRTMALAGFSALQG